MDKEKMEEKGVTDLVMNERNIFNKIDNEFSFEESTLSKLINIFI